MSATIMTPTPIDVMKEEGFEEADLPKRRYIYLDPNLSPSWYFWNSDKQIREPIPYPQLRSCLEGVKIVHRNENEENDKLLIILTKHILVMGKYTYAARSFLWDVYHLMSAGLQKPTLVLRPKAGTNKRVVFLQVRSPNLYLKVPSWPSEQFDWNSFLDSAISTINYWLSQTPLVTKEHNANFGSNFGEEYDIPEVHEVPEEDDIPF